MADKLVVGIGILFIVLSLIMFLFAGWFLPQSLGIEEFSSPIAYILILLFGVLVTISAFFPYKLGKYARIVAYIFLFIFLLIVEVSILKHFVKRVDVNIESCQNIFFPQSSANNIVYDALSYVSCIFTGYVPQNQTLIGWSIFILFYIILPFAFIWAFIHGLMKEIMSNWFQQTPHVISILSFITAIYATRTLFGAFLLTFFGYGVWGLAGIFIAIFLVKGLEKLIENRFVIEEYREELKKLIKNENELRRDFAESAIPILDNVERVVSSQVLNQANRDHIIQQLDSIRNLPTWRSLLKSDQDYLDPLISSAIQAARNLDSFELRRYLNTLKTLLETWRSLR